MTVAVEVFGEFQIARRHELTLAHRAGPRSLETGQIDVAAIQDLEGVEQLAAEKRRPSRVPRQRRQGGNRRADSGEPAVLGLDAPDGDDDARRDAVTFRDAAQQLAV